MARAPRVFGPGLLYHVIARGNHRETVFLGRPDYETYLRRLAVYRARYTVTLHAYCLMPNHVHLVLGTAAPPLDRFMQCLQQSYTQRFNRRYAQVGHVFQGRYKALRCETDEYLVTLVRYVHQNPVRAGLAACAADYPYSGHRAYLGGVATNLVDPTLVLRLVGGTSAYQRLVAGDPADIEPGAAEDPGSRRPHRASLEAALRVLAHGLRVDIDILHGAGRGGPASWARALAAYVLVRRVGYRLTDVAGVLGRNLATASGAVGEVSRRLPEDEAAARQVERLVESLRDSLKIKVKA
jgi:REP element-mobilizing transposase RayT